MFSQIPSLNCTCEVPVTKADKRFFPVSPVNKQSEKWGIVVSIAVDDGSKIITLSGCVQVRFLMYNENSNFVKFVRTNALNYNIIIVNDFIF